MKVMGSPTNGEVYIKVEGNDARYVLEKLQYNTTVRWVGGKVAPLDTVVRGWKIKYLVFWNFSDGTPDFLNMMYQSEKEEESPLKVFMSVDEFIEKYFGLQDEIDDSCFNMEDLL